MDQAIIDQKLESLRRCVLRLKERCPETPELLSEDLDAQDIVSLNLTRAIQFCVDIAAHWLADQDDLGAPQTMGETFSLLAQGDKIPVHNYEAVNWNIVFQLCHEHLDDFRDFARAFSAGS